MVKKLELTKKGQNPLNSITRMNDYSNPYLP